MRMSSDLEPEVWKSLPGALGALFALPWMQGSVWQRLAAFGGGVAASRYAGDWLARSMTIDVGLAGFLVGLFGMAIAAKVFEGIAAVVPAKLVERVLRRLGL